MSSAVTFLQDSAPKGGKTQPVVIYLVSSDSDSSDVGSDSEPKRRRMQSAEHRNRNRTMSTPVTDSSPSPTRVDYMLPKDDDKVIYLSSSDDDEPPRAKSPLPPPSARIYRRLSPSPSPSPISCGRCSVCWPNCPLSPNYFVCDNPVPRSPSLQAAIIAAFGSDCSSDDEPISPPSPSQPPPSAASAKSPVIDDWSDSDDARPIAAPPSPSPSPSPPPRDKSYAARRRAAIIAAFGSDCSSDDESISPPSPSQPPPSDKSPAPENQDHASAVAPDESDDETIADMKRRKDQDKTADTGSAAIVERPKRKRPTGPKSITINNIFWFLSKHYTEPNGIYQLKEGIELDAITKFMCKACKQSGCDDFGIEVDTVFTIGGQKAKTSAQLYRMMIAKRYKPGERGEAMIFFHGTDEKAGMAILLHDFDIRRETRSLHGPGAYISPNFGTAHIYAREKSGYSNKYWMLILIKRTSNITVAPSGIKSFPPDVDCFCEPGLYPKIFSFDPAHNTHLTYALVSYTVKY